VRSRCRPTRWRCPVLGAPIVADGEECKPLSVRWVTVTQRRHARALPSIVVFDMTNAKPGISRIEWNAGVTTAVLRPSSRAPSKQRRGSSQRTCGRRIGEARVGRRQEARATLRVAELQAKAILPRPFTRRVHGAGLRRVGRRLTGLWPGSTDTRRGEFALPAPSALRPGIRPNRARPAIPFPPFLASPLPGQGC